MNKGIYIGIDPGVSTGVCVYDAQTRLITRLQTLSFWPLIDFIATWHKQEGERLTVIVEDPNLNPAMHWNQKKDVKGFNAATKVAQNVGMNKKEAELIIEFLKRNKINCKAIKPTARKVKEDYFKQLSGYGRQTNQHERDAAMLVIGY